MSKHADTPLSAEELDHLFDEGEHDIVDSLDLDQVRHLNLETQRINVDFPRWMVEELDREASRLSIPRQSVIKTWIDEHIRMSRKSASSVR